METTWKKSHQMPRAATRFGPIDLQKSKFPFSPYDPSPHSHIVQDQANLCALPFAYAINDVNGSTEGYAICTPQAMCGLHDYIISPETDTRSEAPS